jgi:phosphoesterase RecJ-like protein
MSIIINNDDFEILDAIKEKIDGSTNIILTTHRNPYGDAIGSTLGFYHYLNSIGKNSKIIIKGPLPFNYKFLPESDKIEIYDDSHFDLIQNCDLIFVIDLNDVERTGSPAEAIKSSNAFKIVVDHHIEPKAFADLYFVKTEATSAGELIYYLCKHKNDNGLCPETASCLYSAIMTDSGSFRFPRTDGTTHRIIADLIDNGADPVELFENIYNIRPKQVVKLLGEAFAGLETIDDKICILTLCREHFEKANACEEDVEDIVEQSLTIENIKLGILLSESLNKDEIRVSFRSKGDISVRDLAVKFNGGGHKNAAGARFFNQSIEDAKKLILDELKNMNI